MELNTLLYVIELTAVCFLVIFIYFNIDLILKFGRYTIKAFTKEALRDISISLLGGGIVATITSKISVAIVALIIISILAIIIIENNF